MNCIVVLDEKNGMSFHHRRQSRDRVLTDRILEISGGRLIVNADTAELFEAKPADLRIAAQPLSVAGAGEWCFVETPFPAPVLEKTEKLVVFRWHRAYPADEKLDLDFLAMRCLSKTDFIGYSHERITEEVYLP